MQGVSKQITIDGVTYKSIREAARAFGVDPTTIQYWTNEDYRQANRRYNRNYSRGYYKANAERLRNYGREQYYKQKIKEPGGVYLITSDSGYRYIGSTACFTHRWSNHRDRLKRGNHPNASMQQLHDACEELRFTVLEEIDSNDEDVLKDRELYYIESLEPELNVMAVKKE